MSFINQTLLYGLIGISIPIILHLLNRRSAKQIEWGAMQFLLDSIESRRRRIQLEEALLLAARCLLCGLVALALARPFQPPGGPIPYVIVLPAFLISLVLITTGIILRETRKYFWWLVGGGLALLIISGLAVAYEKYWNLKRFGNSGRKDIVMIIDGSTSMQIKQGGTTNFDRAIAEAKETLEKSSGGNAFSIILGGPVPLVKVGDPMVNKNDLGQTLDSLKPLQGKMDAFAALTTALTALNRGSNPNKEILVFTDGQSIGWNLESTAAWDALKGSAQQLTTPPPIIYRKFPLPTAFRNVSASNLRLSREVVGTDRPVAIELTLENTGNEAITPTSVELTIAGGEKPASTDPTQAAPATSTGKVLRELKLSQLQPGVKETIRFSHKFPLAGSYVLSAKVVVQDDLPLDDETKTVASVSDRLRVLIVEGNPNADVLKRAATFTALALAPSAKITAAPVKSRQDEKKAKEPDELSKPGTLLDPEVVPHTRLSTMTSFAPYEVIILCNVEKVSDSAARRLGAWVQAGGGLLVAPGSESQAAFYNGWKTMDGESLMPGRLQEMKIMPADKEPLGMALNTFTHSALKLVADAKQSDLGAAVLQRYWRIAVDGANADSTSVGGRLANGDPFLTERSSGSGQVMMSSAAFETGSGNLATRQAFVPLMHQLVYHLSSPEGQPLQRQPSQQINIPLAAGNADSGLKAEYFKGKSFSPPSASTRIEGRMERNFSTNGMPSGLSMDQFSVRYSGGILPRYTDDYIFDGYGDDEMNVWINDQKIIKRGGEGKVKLEAGKYASIRIDYTNSGGNATFQLNWRTSNGQLQQRELVPADVLVPFLPGGDEKEALAGTLPIVGPDNVARTGQLLFTKTGLVARLATDIIPGVYNINLPVDRKKDYLRLLNADGTSTIPFSIADDPAESRLGQWTEQDTNLVKSHFEFLQPKSASEITNILADREFGEELWKYLACGALFILLAEIALTRWIALNRRSGEETTMDFETKFQAPKAFTDQLGKIKQATAA